MEDLRTQARDALLQGARSGKLLEAPDSWLHQGMENLTTW